MPLRRDRGDGVVVLLGVFHVGGGIVTIPWHGGWLGLQYAIGTKMLYRSFHDGRRMRVLVGAKAKSILTGVR